MNSLPLFANHLKKQRFFDVIKFYNFAGLNEILLVASFLFHWLSFGYKMVSSHAIIKAHKSYVTSFIRSI